MELSNCDICGYEGLTKSNTAIKTQPIYEYDCPRCGHVAILDETTLYYMGTPQEERIIASICIRNENEKGTKRNFKNPLFLDDLKAYTTQYRHLSPLEKLDNALINISAKMKLISDVVEISHQNDYPYYHCFHSSELRTILLYLKDEGFISSIIFNNDSSNCTLTPLGYNRLNEIKRQGKDSRKCFVAMWFGHEMEEVFEKAIKPAIEYTEEGQTTPRFQAIKIDQIQHTNDINDEIIAEIRKSRFMVCDLTGYRGGVYFEAGFAYGLGIEVIYTCRKDWIKKQTLKDAQGNLIEELLDPAGNKIAISKEGIHFNLEHRNRIEWDMDDLAGFRDKLEKRIRAVII